MYCMLEQIKTTCIYLNNVTWYEDTQCSAHLDRTCQPSAVTVARSEVRQAWGSPAAGPGGGGAGGAWGGPQGGRDALGHAGSC